MVKQVKYSSAALLCWGLFVTLLCFSAVGQSIEADIEFGRAVVEVNDIQLDVEYASTYAQRARGLMDRAELCGDCGMLFEFESARMAGFWMKNTLIPLDIAYIDSRGIIVDIKPLQPLDLTSVPSSKPVLHALEMNQGWFAANQVSEGDTLTVLQRFSAQELKEGVRVSE
ncbi:DUF192 domain-containing protein [Alteromonas oceanisediminis]|uniref:DUF192 domain-containing protein n=1 Tax=Alteromonas oceanisediminis TaxID=2836180 RepID=UPI001BDB5D0C|nr:DUF192 domain-containing protein [Alteromonas oceanisediminis]MBT0585270.1 DUF192 domain-containing protein [Alteromonas oceanisediminis]